MRGQDKLVLETGSETHPMTTLTPTSTRLQLAMQ